MLETENTPPSRAPSAAPHPLPRFDEVPPLPVGTVRAYEEYLRLMLLPADDVDLRALAVKLFNIDERENNGTDEEEGEKLTLLDLSSTPARTPGGVAWKLAEVLHYFSEEENWEWWRYLLQSALIDAVELERRRVYDDTTLPNGTVAADMTQALAVDA